MELKYSKKKFNGYTHRFIVKISIDEDWRNDINLTLYSNSESYKDLLDFIEKNKTAKVKDYKIEHRSSKEQDEHSAKFIDEMLKDM